MGKKGNDMGQKRKERGRVLSQKEIAPGIFDLWIGCSVAAQAAPGQFMMVYPKAESTILPRPISICEIDRQKGAVRIVYRIAGRGTREFSGYGEGDAIAVMGPLGNGFPMEAAMGKRVFLIGGGIGIPPLLQLAKELTCEKQILAGYRDRHLFLKGDLERHGVFYTATEDGSAGTKGNVLDAVRENGLDADLVYACGPLPMLRAVKDYAAGKGIIAYISLEERMACGVGACLGCVCRTTEKDSHSHVKNARVCTEGPVFAAEEVDI